MAPMPPYLAGTACSVDSVLELRARSRRRTRKSRRQSMAASRHGPRRWEPLAGRQGGLQNAMHCGRASPTRLTGGHLPSDSSPETRARLLQ